MPSWGVLPTSTAVLHGRTAHHNESFLIPGLTHNDHSHRTLHVEGSFEVRVTQHRPPGFRVLRWRLVGNGRRLGHNRQRSVLYV